MKQGYWAERHVYFCPCDTCFPHQIRAKGREIGEFCGKESPGSIETNSSEVDILFLSDESGFSRGWKIHYTSQSKTFLLTGYYSLSTPFVNSSLTLSCSLTEIRCPQPVPQDQFTVIRDLQPLYEFQDYFVVSCKTGFNLVEVRSLLHSPQPYSGLSSVPVFHLSLKPPSESSLLAT